MKNYNLKFKIFYFLIAVFTFSFFIFHFAQAAVLYFEPSEKQLRPGETFILEVRLDTEGECINTVGADISFSQDTLEAVDFSSGNSILVLWVQTPSIDQETGLISFAGGIPGGYCGEIPGAPAESNLLGRIIFKVKEDLGLTLEEGRFGEEQPWARIKFLDSSLVLLNDGRGTAARLIRKGVVFPISFREIVEKPPEDLWQQEIEKDDIPPERFSLQIGQDPAIYEGKYFLTFSATDKQTGIDHYEIKEQKRILFGIYEKKEWEITQSPYLLKDQSLRSKISVKAVDKAGNERIETITPKIGWQDVLPLIILVLAIGIVIWVILKRIITKQKRNL